MGQTNILFTIYYKQYFSFVISKISLIIMNKRVKVMLADLIRQQFELKV